MKITKKIRRKMAFLIAAELSENAFFFIVFVHMNFIFIISLSFCHFAFPALKRYQL